MTMIVVGSIYDQPPPSPSQQDRCEFCKLLIHYSNYKDASGEKIPLELGSQKPHNCLSSSVAKNSILSIDQFIELERSYSLTHKR